MASYTVDDARKELVVVFGAIKDIDRLIKSIGGALKETDGRLKTLEAMQERVKTLEKEGMKAKDAEFMESKRRELQVALVNLVKRVDALEKAK